MQDEGEGRGWGQDGWPALAAAECVGAQGLMPGGRAYAVRLTFPSLYCSNALAFFGGRSNLPVPCSEASRVGEWQPFARPIHYSVNTPPALPSRPQPRTFLHYWGLAMPICSLLFLLYLLARLQHLLLRHHGALVLLTVDADSRPLTRERQH